MLDIISAGFIIFLTHLLEGISGFGGSVLALPFLDMTIGLKTAVKLLCILGFIMALYIVIRSWRSIIWKEFLYISFWAGLGLPCGMLLFDRLPANCLCVLLGMFMIGTGIQGVRKNLSSSSPAAECRNSDIRRSWLMRIFLFCGGIIQGAFGSGGPFMVIYAAKALPDKTVFRVTLSLFWLVTNSCRLINWSIQRTVWNWENFRLLLILFPFMITGLLLGDLLHHKVSAHCFRLGVYTLLGTSGILMFAVNLKTFF
ncbi:MAG: sulfite exporter TauE/SafE family protein [Lentisphaerae bacterium]|nr:sulfite exporter TauE/SafE family protein [Lentisphaerota bacterium]